MDELTMPLTHIAAVYTVGDGWRVWHVYPRGQVPAGHPACHWMLVPAGVRVGDDVLDGEGVTVYADPDWAERRAAERR